MSTRITDEVAGWVGKALDDRIDEPGTKYDVLMTAFPGPGGQPMPGLIVTVSVKHVIIGQWLTGQAVVGTINPTEEQIGQVVNQTLNELQQARTKDAADLNGHGGGDSPLRLS